MQSLHVESPFESASNEDRPVARITVLIAHPNMLVSAGLEAILGREADVEVIHADGSPRELSREQMESASILITECDTALALAPIRPSMCRVLILTADESEVSILRAMERGASGYLLLTATRECVVRAVRRLHEGKTEFSPVVSSKIAASLAMPALSARQLEVLGLLMAGYSDKEIARRLVRSLETAKSHVKAILIKLAVSSRAEAVAVARRRGLVPAPLEARPRSFFFPSSSIGSPDGGASVAADRKRPGQSARVAERSSYGRV